jgi:hypothetical protein
MSGAIVRHDREPRPSSSLRRARQTCGAGAADDNIPHMLAGPKRPSKLDLGAAACFTSTSLAGDLSLSLTGWSAACQLRLDASRLLTESTASCRSDMPWMGMPRQPRPGRVCTALHACIVRRALHGSAPSVRPWRGWHHQSCPAWVGTSRHALNGYAGHACPGWVCIVHHARHGCVTSDMPWMGTQGRHAREGQALSVMPCVGMHCRTCPGWARRSDRPWMGQPCPVGLGAVSHAPCGYAPPDMPWMGTHCQSCPARVGTDAPQPGTGTRSDMPWMGCTDNHALQGYPRQTCPEWVCIVRHAMSVVCT